MHSHSVACHECYCCVVYHGAVIMKHVCNYIRYDNNDKKIMLLLIAYLTSLSSGIFGENYYLNTFFSLYYLLQFISAHMFM